MDAWELVDKIEEIDTPHVKNGPRQHGRYMGLEELKEDGSEYIVLDGSFTPAQLRMIADWMEEHGPIRPKGKIEI